MNRKASDDPKELFSLKTTKESLTWDQVSRFNDRDWLPVKDSLMNGNHEWSIRLNTNQYWSLRPILVKLVNATEKALEVHVHAEGLLLRAKIGPGSSSSGRNEVDNKILGLSTHQTGEYQAIPEAEIDNLLQIEGPEEYNFSGKPRLLVIANSYPSDSAIYRNGFIHTRVRHYVLNGAAVDVYYLHPPVDKRYSYTFQDINVEVGNSQNLSEYLSTHSYDGYLVHFASPDMISPLMSHGFLSRTAVWIHGFEAEAWHRRWFNFLESESSIRAALEKKASYYDRQTEFNNWLYSNKSFGTRFVNVSRWFQKAIVEPDADTEISNSRVIPNLIDTDHFSYHPKEPTSRLHVLSIRPYASYKYANDQTINCILEASKRPWFSNFQFTICGSGADFHRLTQPISDFPNVTLVNKFLNSCEIRDMHAEHGVFLTPSRFDSQGVSACEAMSSGLVPLSSDVAAIPEFIEHERSGLLAEPESYTDLALFLERIYFDIDFYLKLSRGAAKRVREVAGPAQTVKREIELIEEMIGGHR